MVLTNNNAIRTGLRGFVYFLLRSDELKLDKIFGIVYRFIVVFSNITLMWTNVEFQTIIFEVTKPNFHGNGTVSKIGSIESFTSKL